VSGSYEHVNKHLGCTQGRYFLDLPNGAPNIWAYLCRNSITSKHVPFTSIATALVTCNVKVGLGCETTATGPPSMGETTAVGPRTLAALSVFRLLRVKYHTSYRTCRILITRNQQHCASFSYLK
jgi:hypothetical protein